MWPGSAGSTDHQAVNSILSRSSGWKTDVGIPSVDETSLGALPFLVPIVLVCEHRGLMPAHRLCVTPCGWVYWRTSAFASIGSFKDVGVHVLLLRHADSEWVGISAECSAGLKREVQGLGSSDPIGRQWAGVWVNGHLVWGPAQAVLSWGQEVSRKGRDGGLQGCGELCIQTESWDRM